MGLKSTARKGSESGKEKETETDRKISEEVEEDVSLQENGSKESIDCSEKRKKKKHKKKKEEKNKESESVEGQNGEEEEPRKCEKGKRKKEGSDDVAKKNVEMEPDNGVESAKVRKKRKSENSSDGVEVRERIDEKGDGVKKKNGADVEVVKSKKKKKARGESVSNITESDNVDITGLESDVGGDKSTKEKKKKSEILSDIDENNDGDKKRKKSESGDVSSVADEEGVKKIKKRKKTRSENVSNGTEGHVDTVEERDTDKNKQKTKKKKSASEDVSDGVESEAKSNEDGDGKKKKKKRKRTQNENVSDAAEDETNNDNESDKSKKKKKKKKKKAKTGKGEKGKAIAENDMSEGPKPKKKSKRVSFSDDVEVFEDGPRKRSSWKVSNEDGPVQGKRFTLEEDDKVKAAVLSYIEERNLGENGLDMVLNCRKHPKVRHCWKVISEALPQRPIASIYYRAHMLFERSEPNFSDDIEECEDRPRKRSSWKVSDEEGLVQGKRFTLEEDDKVKAAVLSYIEERNLGENGLDMVLNCRKHPEVKNCWKVISEALPQRPLASIYYRAHILFERSELRKWTDEEREFVREFYKKHGSNWKAMAVELKKHRFHCKDLWRRIKRTGLNRGRWKQEEYQNLFDLVNMDLRMRALEERQSKHGMLRDNICWEAIGDRLVTRSFANCCLKWYGQLTSPLVAQGLWADTDDYRLIDALVTVDAPSLDDVDWDSLLEHREGSLARKRWNQMVKHIGDYSKLSFSEQVEVLEKRYNPDCIEAREEFDRKPFSDVDVAVVGDDDSSSSE